ncbi:RNA-directed DNA polymerase, eukaryota [Tanacetum coccineum]|uniref:RNA-directed DNA polymerase, eukaryota n=1 Tax=Tanacetum coccineum TaxID=301880 RepID=A0ABQ5DJL4_9ASTR
MEDTVPADVYSSPVGSKPIHGSHKGGSLLEVLDGMIKALGNSGGILCLWDLLMFRKDQHIISDNFVVLYGSWVPNNTKLLIVSVYAPQSAIDKRLLWSYITGLLSWWNGDVLVTGDFNEVRFERERLGSIFNVHGANKFNSFISNAGLVEIQLEGYSFTWSHPSAAKMSKLDWFLVSEGFLSLFPHISALCLDKNLSDHRPILLREMVTDYGATPFRLYHSWFSFHGFDDMVSTAWNSFVLEDSNCMVRFKKKLQMIKKEIRPWVAVNKRKQLGRLIDIQEKLSGIDHILDQGGVSDEILLSRMELTKQMQDIKSTAVRDQMQKAKIQWVLLIVSAFTYQSRALWLMENGLMSLIVFLSRLTADQISDLEKLVSSDEIRKAVWSCGENKSPGPDGFTFEFFRKYRDSIGPDMCVAVEWFFRHNSFAKVLNGALGGMASVLVNGSPTSEFQFHCGLKQGDPLAPYLFIFVMESLHLSVFRTVEAGIFTGIKIDSALSISHLFYADDAVFIGEWTDSNLRSIIQMLHCFSLASGLKINLQKSNLLGVGVTGSLVNEAAASIGCSVMKAPFKYLGVMVGGNMSKINAWDDMVGKIKSRLSKWKINTLSIGGRLTLLKAVLGSTPIYPMSLYKVPKTVLHEMESLRRNFFNGVQGVDRKISWVKWTKVLASKKYGGLGVSSFYALNRALLFRWVWRFLSHDNSLWFRFISAMHGSSFQIRSSFHCSNWLSIIREVSALKLQGIDFLSHCKRRVGSGMQTRFWEDLWLGEVPFNELFPRLYALENNKECSVAVKMQGEIDSSFRRHVRGGVETQQLENIQDLVRSKVLSNVDDRWAWDLNGGWGLV